METIPEEILLEIINYSIDICDWINFMVSSKNMYKQIYPKFIYKKFKFILFEHQTLSPCIRNNNTKYYVINSYPYYNTTNENHIIGHCQYDRIRFHETYGLFFRALFLNEHKSLEIDHEKIFDIISNNISIFNNYYSNIKEPYIKDVSLIKSFMITKKFIKNYNNEFYEKNMLKAEQYFNRYITKQEQKCIQNLKLEYPKTEYNTCIFCNTKYINDDSQFHKNWFITYNRFNYPTTDAEIILTDFKMNSSYHPKNYITKF